ncbi:MAG: hypothetical protein K0S40_773 [Actinomycetospora sp.]|nr:hypothetical protein [Actinomycetospora sp.]
MTTTLEHDSTIEHDRDTECGGSARPDHLAATLRAEREPARVRPRLLLVGLLDDDSDDDARTHAVDLLDRAAQRARADQRPLVVVLARQRLPWSTHAVLHVLAVDRIDAQLDALRQTVHQTCDRAGWSARILTIAEPLAWTRRGRHRRWHRRLATLAGLLGAELYPPPDHHPPLEPPDPHHDRMAPQLGQRPTGPRPPDPISGGPR